MASFRHSRLGFNVIQPSGRAGVQNCSNSTQATPYGVALCAMTRLKACAKPKPRTYEIVPSTEPYPYCEAWVKLCNRAIPRPQIRRISRYTVIPRIPAPHKADTIGAQKAISLIGMPSSSLMI